MSNTFKLRNGRILISTEAPGGIYNASQLKKIASLCDGDSVMVKATEDQRLALIVNPDKANFVASELKSMGLGIRHYQDGLHQPVSCIGEMCEHHEQDALGSALDISAEIEGIKLTTPLKIGINGCARCCVPCHTLDVSVVGDSQGYRISLGGKNSQLPEIAGFIAEGVPTSEIARLIRAIVELYRDHAQNNETLQELIDREGSGIFIKALAPWSQDAADTSDPFATTTDEPVLPNQEQEPLDFGTDEPRIDVTGASEAFNNHVGVDFGSEPAPLFNEPAILNEDSQSAATREQTIEAELDIAPVDTETMESNQLATDTADPDEAPESLNETGEDSETIGADASSPQWEEFPQAQDSDSESGLPNDHNEEQSSTGSNDSVMPIEDSLAMEIAEEPAVQIEPETSTSIEEFSEPEMTSTGDQPMDVSSEESMSTIPSDQSLDAQFEELNSDTGDTISEEDKAEAQLNAGIDAIQNDAETEAMDFEREESAQLLDHLEPRLEEKFADLSTKPLYLLPEASKDRIQPVVSAESETTSSHAEASNETIEASQAQDQITAPDVIATQKIQPRRSAISKKPWTFAGFDLDDQGNAVISWSNGVELTLTQQAINEGCVRIGGREIRIEKSDSGIHVEIDGMRMFLPVAA